MSTKADHFVTRQHISMGALALVLCLALPMGVLSLFAPPSTGDEVDAADTIVVARIVSMQYVAERESTILEFGITQHVIGDQTPRQLTLTFEGRPPVEVGDLVVALLSLEPATIHGTYQVLKSAATLEYEVVTPITGMWTEGVIDRPPVELEQFLEAVRVRRGLTVAGLLGEPVGDSAEGGVELGVAADAYEPNNTLGTATQLFLNAPSLITGMPTEITGLTITTGDVDYFTFDGPGLSLLHAETRLPPGVTALTLDTLLGAFYVPTGELFAYNDDKDASMMSRLVVPLEHEKGPFAVAIESAPDPTLAFDGQGGTTVGAYELLLELEKASYITNEVDLIAGVSLDGTFIEDLVGFKVINGVDVLLDGKPADGWSLSYDAQLPTGVSSIFAGVGDYLVPPTFNAAVLLRAFTLQPYVDNSGFNRNGGATSVSIVPYQLLPSRGVGIRTVYGWPLGQRVLKGQIILNVTADDALAALTFARILDVNLFDVGTDKFTYSFSLAEHVKVFPVDTTTNTANLTLPATTSGEVVGDYQAALLVEYGSIPAGTFDELPTTNMAYTLVKGFIVESDAINAAIQNLKSVGMSTWVIASDVDPDTGLYTAFGVGLGARPL